MYKIFWFGVCVLVVQDVWAQSYRMIKPKKQLAPDSLKVLEWKEETVSELPVVVLNETTRADDAIAFLPSILSANRDVLVSTASFHFNTFRFRLRGYDADCFTTLVNGIAMNNPEDGNTPWGYWSGLNDVTRNTQQVLGLRAGEMDFGNIGTVTGIDMRASKQRAQTQMGYAFSNRSYTHRLSFTNSRATDRRGWAFSFSGSLRYAAEGYVAGSFYRGGSYFIGVDKKIGESRLLSLCFFGAVVNNSKQSAVLKEVAELGGTGFYNAYWGWQQGHKRNANTYSAHVPVMTLNYEHTLSNHRTLLLSLAGMAGKRSATAMDWYNAPDPRPDYYRYLPSYQQDTVLRETLTAIYKTDPDLLQVNWDKLYAINQNSYELTHDVDGVAGNSTGGLRSHYILEERITGIKRVDMNALYTSMPGAGIRFNGGAMLQYQQLHYYKKINDLLGGEYYVDWNQFAEGDASVIQNDLNRPNRILREGDKYGYDYSTMTTIASAWVQLTVTRKKTDLFAAARLTYTNYLRDGKVQTGLFPDNSLGRSKLHEFTDYAFKMGITWKISGRRYVYLHAAVLSKAPLFDNVFISPRTRDTEQEILKPEKIQSAEAGYIWSAPDIKLRWTAYVTRFADGMNVLSFYHDGYRSFVNYAISGISKLHTGMELGSEIKLSARYTLNAAAAVGRYYYNRRQQLTVSADNDAYITERGLIYSLGFRIAGTPQEAYSIGINYQSKGAFYMNLTGSYFRERWMEFNPVRRTYTALQHVQPATVQWQDIISQSSLPDQCMFDLTAGSSFRIKTSISERKQTLLFFISINNLLNDRQAISGGYEQLRFDSENGNTNKFPLKFFYAMGLNYSVNISLRW